jgi:orotidine-5'-phosphate decarboxylase
MINRRLLTVPPAFPRVHSHETQRPKMGESDAKTATDHVLHGRGVLSAGRPDTAGKMLNKTLDRRHETLIKLFGQPRYI